MTQRQFERGIVAVVLFIVVALFSVEMQGQVVVAPMPFVKSQFFNGSTPCNGCKLYSYAAATTTPLVTYTDSTGAVANANPLVLDSSGYGNVWLGNSSYKLVLKTSADVTIWTEDGVKTELVAPQITGKVIITVVNNSETALTVSNSGTGGFGANFNSTGTNSVGLLASGSLVAIRGTAGVLGSTVAEFNATSGTGTQFGIAVKDSLGTRNFGVTDNGTVTTNSTITSTGRITSNTSLVINGGTALTTTNQTGSGNLVLQSSPTLVTPNIGAATAASLAATTITVGGGTALSKTLSTSFVFDFGSIAAGTCADSTAQTLTGAVDGDAVFVGALAAAISPIQVNITAYVSVADQVKVRACNPTVGAIDPASTTFRVVDMRF